MKTGIENKMAPVIQTKSDELTPDETRLLKKFVTDKLAGTWPRKVDVIESAVNVAPPAETQFPKSKAHKEAEANVEAARSEFQRLQQLVFEQERAHSENVNKGLTQEQQWGTMGHLAKMATAYQAPAKAEFEAAESVLHLAMIKLNRFDREYHARQRGWLTRDSRADVDEPSLIKKAAMVLGLS